MLTKQTLFICQGPAGRIFWPPADGILLHWSLLFAGGEGEEAPLAGGCIKYQGIKQPFNIRISLDEIFKFWSKICLKYVNWFPCKVVSRRWVAWRQDNQCKSCQTVDAWPGALSTSFTCAFTMSHFTLQQGMVDGPASKPELRQDTGYMVEKTYHDIAPYLGTFGAYLMSQ